MDSGLKPESSWGHCEISGETRAAAAGVIGERINEMRKSYLAFLLILAAGSGGAVWFGARSSPVQGSERAAPCCWCDPAARRDVPIYLYGLGNVQAYNSCCARSGRRSDYRGAFKEGQQLKAGDILVKIDPRIYQASLDQAVAKGLRISTTRKRSPRSQALHLAYRKNSVARQQFDTTQAQVAQLERPSRATKL